MQKQADWDYIQQKIPRSHIIMTPIIFELTKAPTPQHPSQNQPPSLPNAILAKILQFLWPVGNDKSTECNAVSLNIHEKLDTDTFLPHNSTTTQTGRNKKTRKKNPSMQNNNEKEKMEILLYKRYLYTSCKKSVDRMRAYTMYR